MTSGNRRPGKVAGRHEWRAPLVTSGNRRPGKVAGRHAPLHGYHAVRLIDPSGVGLPVTLLQALNKFPANPVVLMAPQKLQRRAPPPKNAFGECDLWTLFIQKGGMPGPPVVGLLSSHPACHKQAGAFNIITDLLLIPFCRSCSAFCDSKTWKKQETRPLRATRPKQSPWLTSSAQVNGRGLL